MGEKKKKSSFVTEADLQDFPDQGIPVGWTTAPAARMEIRRTELLVGLAEESVFADGSFRVQIKDEGAEEFLEVTLQMEGYGSIAIDPVEWPVLRSAIDEMMKECKYK